MMSTVIEYIATIAESMIAANFIIAYNGVKYNKNKYIAFAVTSLSFFLCVSFFNYFTFFESIYGIAYIIDIFICSLVFLEGRISKKIFSSVLCMAFVVLINMTITALFSYIFDLSITQLFEGRNYVRIITLFLTKFLYFLACQITLILNKKANSYLNRLEWLMITLFFLITMSVSLIIINFAYKYQITEKEYYLMYGATAGMIIINIVAFYLFIVLNKQHKQMMQFNAMKIHNEQREKALDDLKALSTEMRKIKHDTSKFIDVTSALITEGKSQQALNYLSELKHSCLEETFQTITTSNDIVNAILNTKRSYCLMNGIEFNYRITADLSVYSDLDISILLGNLLDNAIEGTEGSEKPYIKISISESKAYLMIIVSNPVAKPVMENNPDLRTTKKDKSNHGMGLLSIKDIVNKYDGMLNFDESDGVFSADVRLKSPSRF